MPQVTLDGNAADTDKQHGGICQGGVTPPRPRGPMPTAGRDVTEVVCGVIRQQRYRMRRQAKNDFLRLASRAVQRSIVSPESNSG